MEVLRHENIIKFIEAGENLDSYIYVMEFIDGIDLY